MLPTIAWRGRSVIMIDQRKLPGQETYVRCRTYIQVAQAIGTMVVRGAPAIGIAAAYGMALGAMALSRRRGARSPRFARSGSASSGPGRRPGTSSGPWRDGRSTSGRGPRACGRSGRPWSTRPRPSNARTPRPTGPSGRTARRCSPTATVLTHCNAGALATAGTAPRWASSAPPSRRASDPGLRRRDPALPPGRAPDRLGARPGRHPGRCHHRLHGRLLHAPGRGQRRRRRGRPHRPQRRHRQQDRHLFAGRAGQGERHPVLCRRAHEHDRPYAPRRGGIPIEERSPDEVANRRAADTSPTWRCATPRSTSRRPRYITAIVTERGVHRPPYDKSLAGPD